MEHIKRIWPSPADLAADLGKPYTTVHSWLARGSIPARYDLALIAAAKARGHSLSLEDLAACRGVMAARESSVENATPSTPPSEDAA